ncbi:Lyzozyme M1 (1,4-beta-N-acetylmuramidase), GH25 family [Arthrobacter alpinus]|uniref:Lyzozyme M1 (1,4-beta-N-acetylmuramidase), GH25 family n=1 Tax=Arthrobacter alpinus TaxID=656366 RepID=A0A1H5PFE7_9MICC|nr:GH25 family lysozyme [Arthrobacter alpinus]SEF11797.1 Lyzozyme M1 (1,4-beta-N-acetylmuramidase), GH25 family [Arthrobacter alpinus]
MKKFVPIVLTLTLAIGLGSAVQSPANAVSNSPATLAGTNQFTVKIETGFGTCTGSLIDRQWIATAASCFTEDPSKFASLVAGKPARASKALFGSDAANRDKPGIAITYIQPPDGPNRRDFVLAKLANPVNNIVPLKVSSVLPSAGEKISFTGYGRTSTEWLPTQSHTADFSIATIDSTALEVTPTVQGAGLCAGDSGAPGVRATPTGPELAAVNSRSWQGGCLYVETQNTGAIASRVDDISGWINSVIVEGRRIPGIGNHSVVQIKTTAPSANCLTLQANTGQTVSCKQGLDQQWQLFEISPNTFLLRNSASQECLSGTASPQRAQLIHQASCNIAAPLQSWELVPGTNGQTILKNGGNQSFTGFRTPAASTPAFHSAPQYTVNVEWKLTNVGTYSGTGIQGTPISQSPGAGSAQNPSAAGPRGLEVSEWQSEMNWAAQKTDGITYSYIKATEGNSFTNSHFATQQSASKAAGLLTGAYHLASPDVSTGAEQAHYFVTNGGVWNLKGSTMPPGIDLAANPGTQTDSCYGLTPAQMVSWITDFSNIMVLRVGRLPAIFTTTSWWNQCTANSQAFKDSPLNLVSHEDVPGSLPAGWAAYKTWQYADSATITNPAGTGFPSVFNGSVDELKTYVSTAGTIPAIPELTFPDVPAGRLYYKEISWLANVGVTTGWPDGTFRPASPVNRDAMAAFMYRLAGSPAFTPPATSPFPDVATNNMYYKQITWLNSFGVTTGWPDGTFRPLSPVNRDSMAAFMYRLAGSPAFTPPATSPFPDVATNNMYYKEITWLASTGISTGWPDKTFRPLNSIDRDAMAAFMYRLNSYINNK